MKSLKGITWTVYRWTLDLFIPPQCVQCGKVETWLCNACAQKLSIFTGPFCSLCGRPWESPSPCRVCQDTPLSVSPIRSAYLFQDNIRDLLHALKYRGGQSMIRQLAQPMARAWHELQMHSDALVPVPLHPVRLEKRGYNQAAILARGLAQEIGIPMRHALERVRDTPSQTRLNSKERRKNVEAAFTYIAGDLLAGKCVTLIDDVATTGATLDACATVLLAQGIKSVNAFTLARAP